MNLVSLMKDVPSHLKYIFLTIGGNLVHVLQEEMFETRHLILLTRKSIGSYNQQNEASCLKRLLPGDTTTIFVYFFNGINLND